MRTFSAEYLRETRAGMWAESRAALEPLALPTRDRVLDVGCGTGELTQVLAEETPGDVVGLDADRDLIAVAADGGLAVAQGDALSLPFPDDSFDLVVCQALLINLPDPAAAVREFARVSSDLVAAVEPDNGAVSVRSTVPTESQLAASARDAYIAGVDTDVTLGDAAAGLLRKAGLDDVETRTHYHTKTIEPPYSEADLEAARRKATATTVADARETLLAGDLTVAEFDALLTDWRRMGREVVDQMSREEYRRAEVVPFHVTVGRTR
ncbi:class I SAM-dependent methyltransferase [Halobacteriaceae archaeon GCM10025711]